jgi:hypothetical protein
MRGEPPQPLGRTDAHAQAQPDTHAQPTQPTYTHTHTHTHTHSPHMHVRAHAPSRRLRNASRRFRTQARGAGSGHTCARKWDGLQVEWAVSGIAVSGIRLEVLAVATPAHAHRHAQTGMQTKQANKQANPNANEQARQRQNERTNERTSYALVNNRKLRRRRCQGCSTGTPGVLYGCSRGAPIYLPRRVELDEHALRSVDDLTLRTNKQTMP